jgi:ABC-2 type transport system permease protein
MRKIAAIAWKDTLIRFSSRSEILFFFLLPIVFTFILGRSTPGGESSGDNRILLPVVDEDKSALSAELLAALADSEVVRPVALAPAEALEQLEDEDVPAILTIPAGFEVALLGGKAIALHLRQAPNNSNSIVVEQAIQAAIGPVSQALTAASVSVGEAEQRQPFATEAERQAYFSQSLAVAQELTRSAPERIQVTQPAATVVEDNTFNMAAHQSAGQLVTWVFIPLLATSGFLAFERTKGTLRRLITTPTASGTFLLGVITGQLGAGLAQMLLLVGFGTLVMGVNWGQSPVALLLMMLAFGLASVALGTMLGTFVKTDDQASSISIMFGMTMALLGGCWFPLELFPEFARTAAQALPTTWAMQGFTDLVIRGQGLAEIVPEAAVLTAFAALFFAIGAWRFRYA